MTEKPILEVEHLSKVFYPSSMRSRRDGTVKKAVDDVSFSVMPGETFGIVGESGCGKTTLGKTILRLYEPTTGSAYLDGQDIFSANKQELKQLRKKMQIVFQDPYASLDPQMTIRNIIREPLDIDGELSLTERNERVCQIMDWVGMHRDYLERFPYEFSGGQRQRICIARALALNPRLIICDEPVSALDVSVQSQVLNLFQQLQDRLGLTYLFISHDLSVVQHISDRICVMYLGQIMELGTTENVYKNPMHPYTQCLLSSVLQPVPNTHSFQSGDDIAKKTVLRPKSDTGCPFYPRCPYATEICALQQPDMQEVEPGHMVKCHHICK